MFNHCITNTYKQKKVKNLVIFDFFILGIIDTFLRKHFNIFFRNNCSS